jgi:hypothetical protein
MLTRFEVQVYKSSEELFTKAVSHYPHKDAFFEMVRFDFVIDENLKVRFVVNLNRIEV